MSENITCHLSYRWFSIALFAYVLVRLPFLTRYPTHPLVSQVPLAALEALDIPSNRSLPAAKYLREVERRVAKDGSASIFRRDQDALAVRPPLPFTLNYIFTFCAMP
jgi:hypothetical protein